MKYRSMLLASAALHAGFANGMGLGNIDVQSYLGAPLAAQIDLLSPRDFGDADIRVNLARLDVYDRFQARYEASHGDIQFDVITTSSGEKAILLRTAKRQVEPFLDIVVELSWPTGTTYRRYNLLLDPPGYGDRWNKVQPALDPVLTRAVVQAKPVTTAPELPGIPMSGDYVVKVGDSLWKIARNLRGATGLSIQQTMDLLYSQNSHAFIGGDRNRLKLGAMLSVPAETIEAPVAEDVRLDQVASQSYQATEPAIVFEETQPSSVSVIPVVSGEQAPEAISELERVKRQLAALQAERSQLAAFQDQVRAEMAQLQGQQQAMKQTILLAEQITEDLAASAEGNGMAVDSVPPKSIQLSPFVAPPIEESIPSAPEPRQAVAQDLIGDSADNANMLIEKSGAGFWYLLAMVPLGILIVLMGMRMRRVEAIRRTEEIRDEDLYELVFGAKRDRSKVDSPDQVRQAVSHIKEKASHHEAITLGDNRPEEEASKSDVDQMIELYMLYRQYQKALNVILTEIAKRPARKDLRLCLMQVYAQTGDWDAFEEQMEVLHRIGDAALIQSAELLRSHNGYETLHRNAS